MLVIDSDTAIDMATDAAAGPARVTAVRASLLERLGGASAIAAAVDQLYLLILGDARLRGFFTDVGVAGLKRRQTKFFVTVLGGGTWAGRSMKEVHRAMPIEPKHFAAVAEHLATSLRSLGVADPLVAEVLRAVAPLADEIVNTR
jgi:hemoglobin